MSSMQADPTNQPSVIDVTHSSAAIPSQARTEPVATIPAETAVTSLPPLASGVPTSVLGFAVIITMLSLSNTTLIGSAALFIPVATIVGTLAIGIGGLYEIRNGDLFGGTFGITYAAFLLSTGAALKFFAPAATADAKTVGAFGDAVGSYFLLWALISVIFTVAALMVNKTAVIAFALLATVLLLAGLANIVGGDTAVTLTKAAGWAGLADGVAAFWLAGGLILNTMYNRDMLPLGSAMATPTV